MKTQITQRQKDERARRKAMPIALVQKPLRYIQGNLNTKALVNGQVQMVVHPIAADATYLSARGLGGIVREIARRLCMGQIAA